MAVSYLFCGRLVVKPLAIPSTSFMATDKPKHKKKDAKGDSKKTNEISPGCIVEVKLSYWLSARACAIARLGHVVRPTMTGLFVRRWVRTTVASARERP